MKYIIGQVQLGPDYMTKYESCYGCTKNGELTVIGQGSNIKPGLVGVNGIILPTDGGQQNLYLGNPIPGANGIPIPGSVGPSAIPLSGAIQNFGQSGIKSTLIGPSPSSGAATGPQGVGAAPRMNTFLLQEPPNMETIPASSANGYLTPSVAVDCGPTKQVALDLQPIPVINSVQSVPVVQAVQPQEVNKTLPSVPIPDVPHVRMGPMDLPVPLPQIPVQNKVPLIPQLENIIPLTNAVPDPVNYMQNFMPPSLQALNYLTNPQLPQIPNMFQNPYTNYGQPQNQGPAVRAFVPQNQQAQPSPPQNYLGYNYLYPTMNPYIQEYYKTVQRYIPNVGLNLTAGPLQAGLQAGQQPGYPGSYPGYGLAANTNLNLGPHLPLNAGGSVNVGLPKPAGLTDSSNSRESPTSFRPEDNPSTVEIEHAS